MFDTNVTLEEILAEINPDIDNDFEATDNQGYSMEGICEFRGRKFNVYVSYEYGRSDWKYSVAKDIYEQLHGILLAHKTGERTEEYRWFPTAHAEDIPDIGRSITGSDDYTYFNHGQRYINNYCVDTDHMWDFDIWKNALVNRTQTFKRNDIILEDENIKRFYPGGYIVMIKDKSKDFHV